MLVAIHAFENIYQGLHGIEDYVVVEVADEKDAIETALNMSYEVIDSYGDIYSDFYSDAEFEGLEEGTDEWEEYIEAARAEDTAFDIFLVKETTKTLEELNNMIYHDPEGFIEEYCTNME